MRAQDAPVMVLPGAFSVSPAGGATYAIPIKTPPGTAGLQPSLALSYSSQGGNGIMGLGWDISSLAVITRCQAHYDTTNDRHVAVDYDGDDFLCLNGECLMATTAGTYGANNMEYRTERATGFTHFQRFRTRVGWL